MTELVSTADAIPTDATDAWLVRQIVQPGLLGLMDGSVSTLAPLFATANFTGSLLPRVIDSGAFGGSASVPALSPQPKAI